MARPCRYGQKIMLMEFRQLKDGRAIEPGLASGCSQTPCWTCTRNGQQVAVAARRGCWPCFWLYFFKCSDLVQRFRAVSSCVCVCVCVCWACCSDLVE